VKSFVNPALLVGLVWVGVPLLIHLLLRDRVRRVAFSTLRFFGGVSKKMLRRKRFQELLLIILRMVACALAALAFARPILGALGGAPDDPLADVSKARVVVVDVSGSMARSTEAEGLQGQTLPWLRDLGSADACALVAFDSAPQVLAPFAKDTTDARKAAAKLRPGHAGSNVRAGLRKADELLGEVTADAKEIVLVSDLQRAGWDDPPGDWKLTPGTELLVQPMPFREEPGNLAIVEGSYPESLARDQSPQNIAVRIVNNGKNPAKAVKVSLSVNGKRLETKKVFVPAGGKVAARFRHVFDKGGDNPGVVSLDTPDLAADDNRLYFNARVIPQIRILLVSTTGPGRANTSEFFLRAALSPGKQSPFEVKSLPVGKVTAASVQSATVAILADVNVPVSLASELKRLLKRGGGVLMLPGSSVKPEAFAAALGELAPCKLAKVVARKRPDGSPLETGLSSLDYTHPAFEVFLAPHHGDFGTIGFKRYWEASGAQLSRVLAKYDDGRPAILERKVAKGTCVLWLSAVDLGWSDLPFRALYLPMLHQTIRYLAVRTEQRTGYAVGEVLPVPQGGALLGPDGAAVEGAPVATAPGFYQVVGADGGKLTLAVNVPAAESDEAVMSDKEIAAAVKPAPEKRKQTTLKESADPAGQGDRGLWLYLLAALMVLLMGELFVGNRTVRH
jgi:hypothetical protein